MILILYSTIFILGAVVGSFLNACIWRVHVHKDVVSDRSECIQCHTKLQAKHLVPILSYVFLQGKCHACKKHISWQYPLVEFILGILFVLAYVYIQSLSFELLFVWFVLSICMFIFVYDLRYQLILDRITLPAIVLILSYNIYINPQLWWIYLFGGILGGGFFLLQYLVSRGRWIGGGDIRLGVLMGVLLGWKLLIVALFIAYVFGATVSLILIAMKKKTLASTTPFGTYLIIGTVVSYVVGEALLQWYIQLVKF